MLVPTILCISFKLEHLKKPIIYSNLMLFKNRHLKKDHLNCFTAVLLDLLFAGIETTSTALTWSVLYMIKYPEVQKKVQQEILTTIGQSRHSALKIENIVQ